VIAAPITLIPVAVSPTQAVGIKAITAAIGGAVVVIAADVVTQSRRADATAIDVVVATATAAIATATETISTAATARAEALTTATSSATPEMLSTAATMATTSVTGQQG
jgi:hypothetical protein